MASSSLGPGDRLGDYFTATPGGETGMSGMGAGLGRAIGRSPDGIGALGSVLDVSPLMRDLRKMKRKRPLRGFGAEGDPVPVIETVESTMPSPSPGMLMAGLLLGAVVRGAAGYVVGKAVAPTPESEKKYAYWGIPVGIFFGTLGIGVQAGIALSKR